MDFSVACKLWNCVEKSDFIRNDKDNWNMEKDLYLLSITSLITFSLTNEIIS